MEEELLLTPEKAADLLGIHKESARRLLRQGKLPGVKVGGGWRIPRSRRLQDMLDGKPAAGKKRTVPRKPAASAGAPRRKAARR